MHGNLSCSQEAAGMLLHLHSSVDSNALFSMLGILSRTRGTVRLLLLLLLLLEH